MKEPKPQFRLITMLSAKIKSIKAREILDSRGNPTIEVELTSEVGVFRASVPSGASTGKYEAVELRDGGKRYQGKGVLRVVKNINDIIGPSLKNKDVAGQKEIDELMIAMDGTENKSKLGANAIVGVSMACCRAGAAAKNIPLWKYLRIQFGGELVSSKLARGGASGKLPTACFNIINGGAHAGNELDFQEFMIVLHAKPFSKILQISSEIYHQLKELINKKYGDLASNIGDEGGFAPPVKDPEEAINLILEAAEILGYKNKIKIALDVAASQFYKEGQYKTNFGFFSTEGLVDYYSNLLQKYPISILEDPFAQDNWEGWIMLKSKTKGSKIFIIGDDLLVTNPKKIKEAQKQKACNGLLLKVNQIGTVTEAMEAARLAKSFGWKTMVSHRSGETCDDFIADLAVGIGADFIKAGAPARGERVAKYNRLLKIEEEIYG